MFDLIWLKIVMKYVVFTYITECLKTICYVTTLSQQNIFPLNHLIITRTSQMISRSLNKKPRPTFRYLDVMFLQIFRQVRLKMYLYYPAHLANYSLSMLLDSLGQTKYFT